MKKVEKDVVLDEVLESLNWKEKMIVKFFKKTFGKVYNLVRIYIVNMYLK